MLCTPRHSVLRILRILRTDPSGLPAPSKPFGLHLIGRCPSHPGLTQHLSTGAGGRLLASSRCSPGMLLPVLRCMPPPPAPENYLAPGVPSTQVEKPWSHPLATTVRVHLVGQGSNRFLVAGGGVCARNYC